MPVEERNTIEQSEEIGAFLSQSRISERNVARLETLVDSPIPRIAKLAALTLEVARIRPYKKRRLRILSKERPDLLQKLNETGLIVATW